MSENPDTNSEVSVKFVLDINDLKNGLTELRTTIQDTFQPIQLSGLTSGGNGETGVPNITVGGGGGGAGGSGPNIYIGSGAQINEVETGVPLGQLIGGSDSRRSIYVNITNVGGTGGGGGEGGEEAGRGGLIDREELQEMLPEMMMDIPTRMPDLASDDTPVDYIYNWMRVQMSSGVGAWNRVARSGEYEGTNLLATYQKALQLSASRNEGKNLRLGDLNSKDRSLIDGLYQLTAKTGSRIIPDSLAQFKTDLTQKIIQRSFNVMYGQQGFHDILKESFVGTGVEFGKIDPNDPSSLFTEISLEGMDRRRLDYYLADIDVTGFMQREDVVGENGETLTQTLFGEAKSGPLGSGDYAKFMRDARNVVEAWIKKHHQLPPKGMLKMMVLASKISTNIGSEGNTREWKDWISGTVSRVLGPQGLEALGQDKYKWLTNPTEAFLPVEFGELLLASDPIDKLLEMGDEGLNILSSRQVARQFVEPLFRSGLPNYGPNLNPNKKIEDMNSEELRQYILGQKEKLDEIQKGYRPYEVVNSKIEVLPDYFKNKNGITTASPEEYLRAGSGINPVDQVEALAQYIQNRANQIDDIYERAKEIDDRLKQLYPLQEGENDFTDVSDIETDEERAFGSFMKPKQQRVYHSNGQAPFRATGFSRAMNFNKYRRASWWGQANLTNIPVSDLNGLLNFSLMMRVGNKNSELRRLHMLDNGIVTLQDFMQPTTGDTSDWFTNRTSGGMISTNLERFEEITANWDAMRELEIKLAGGDMNILGPLVEPGVNLSAIINNKTHGTVLSSYMTMIDNEIQNDNLRRPPRDQKLRKMINLKDKIDLRTALALMVEYNDKMLDIDPQTGEVKFDDFLKIFGDTEAEVKRKFNDFSQILDDRFGDSFKDLMSDYSFLNDRMLSVAIATEATIWFPENKGGQ